MGEADLAAMTPKAGSFLADSAVGAAEARRGRREATIWNFILNGNLEIILEGRIERNDELKNGWEEETIFISAF